MPMRTECRFYESRSYPNGETVRKCRLDLAPEAPWRCPDDCPSFALRRIDAGWHYGSLGRAEEPPEAEPEGEHVAALLDAAKDVVNAAAPDIIAEYQAKEAKRGRRRGKRRR
jgi:thioesterase domain-containing protein